MWVREALYLQSLFHSPAKQEPGGCLKGHCVCASRPSGLPANEGLPQQWDFVIGYWSGVEVRAMAWATARFDGVCVQTVPSGSFNLVCALREWQVLSCFSLFSLSFSPSCCLNSPHPPTFRPARAYRLRELCRVYKGPAISPHQPQESLIYNPFLSFISFLHLPFSSEFHPLGKTHALSWLVGGLRGNG